ncbi:MAG: DUF354 domain-containing protein [Kiritimatiellae bacterium]|nr:DUF354 domain-containing protein [Kiritimatiellia bacterium]
MKIWIDLDHSPHVQVFRPILPELRKLGADILVTVRDFNQTVGMCRLWNIPHTVVGKHGGGKKMGKILNLIQRAGQLRRVAASFHPDLAISHGSRTQIVAAKTMGVPSLVMMDYEYTEAHIFKSLPRVILMPSPIPDEVLRAQNFPMPKVRRYEGLKEELYLPLFQPEPGFRKTLGVPEDSILVTIRPSAMVANYHDARSEDILLELLRRAVATPGAWPLFISRTREDRDFVGTHFAPGQVHFLEQAVDGLQLIWQSDVLISGGGTMNREAAVLGVPVYSIFTGRRPYLDEYLAKKGRMQFVDTPDKVGLVRFEKRHIPPSGPAVRGTLAKDVAQMILRCVEG